MGQPAGCGSAVGQSAGCGSAVGQPAGRGLVAAQAAGRASAPVEDAMEPAGDGASARAQDATEQALALA